MCCALRTLPVTDFMSDHPFGGMSGISKSAPHLRRDESFPVRTAPPPREQPNEDVALAQHSIVHPQGVRSNEQTREQQQAYDSPSPAPEHHSPITAPSAERKGLVSPRSASLERSQREQSQPYAPMMSLFSDAAPSGQVCR